MDAQNQNITQVITQVKDKNAVGPQFQQELEG